MSRYIDADKIKYKHIVVFPDREDENSVYKSEIDAIPTADVVSREEYNELKRENEFLKRMQRSLTQNMSNQKLGLIVKENL